jgi:foldase protein PrsA
MLTFLRKKMKVIMIIIAVVFVVSMFYGLSFYNKIAPSSSGAIKDLAKVNGQMVSPARYGEMLNRLARQIGEKVGPQDIAFVQNMALAQTIDFTIILQEAKRRVRVSNDEVEAAINGIMQQQQIPSRRDLDQALKRMGLSLGQLKEMIKDEILVQKMVSKVRQEVTVTPNDLREIRVSHILVSNEAIAKEILTQLNNGGNFAVLAKKYSLDPGSADKGGELGYFSTGMMVEPFEKAAFSLKVGETSGIVKTSFGYHIIRVADSRLRKFKGPNIDQAALQDKQDKVFQKWFGELKTKAKIEVLNSALKAHSLRFRGQIFEAIQAYKDGISRSPRDPYLHIFLGDTYKMIGKNDLALQEYESAISIEGGDPNLYFVLAKAFEAMGKKDLAVAEYRKASLIAGDNKALHQELQKRFRELNAYRESSNEQAEIARIDKKEKFEKELKGN